MLRIFYDLLIIVLIISYYEVYIIFKSYIQLIFFLVYLWIKINLLYKMPNLHYFENTNESFNSGSKSYMDNCIEYYKNNYHKNEYLKTNLQEVLMCISTYIERMYEYDHELNLFFTKIIDDIIILEDCNIYNDIKEIYERIIELNIDYCWLKEKIEDIKIEWDNYIKNIDEKYLKLKPIIFSPANLILKKRYLNMKNNFVKIYNSLIHDLELYDKKFLAWKCYTFNKYKKLEIFE